MSIGIQSEPYINPNAGIAEAQARLKAAVAAARGPQVTPMLSSMPPSPPGTLKRRPGFA
jgi:hypothetical protein